MCCLGEARAAGEGWQVPRWEELFNPVTDLVSKCLRLDLVLAIFIQGYELSSKAVPLIFCKRTKNFRLCKADPTYFSETLNSLELPILFVFNFSKAI